MLDKEREILELTILVESKKRENFMQAQEYSRTKAILHELQHKTASNNQPQVLSSAAKRSVSKGENNIGSFETQFEKDLFSSAKSSRRKTCFGEPNKENSLGKRSISRKPLQDYVT